jgi:hypothetical protein
MEEVRFKLYAPFGVGIFEPLGMEGDSRDRAASFLVLNRTLPKKKIVWNRSALCHGCHQTVIYSSGASVAGRRAAVTPLVHGTWCRSHGPACRGRVSPPGSHGLRRFDADLRGQNSTGSSCQWKPRSAVVRVTSRPVKVRCLQPTRFVPARGDAKRKRQDETRRASVNNFSIQPGATSRKLPGP